MKLELPILVPLMVFEITLTAIGSCSKDRTTLETV